LVNGNSLVNQYIVISLGQERKKVHVFPLLENDKFGTCSLGRAKQNFFI
jgi:hypothetical protein